MKKSDIKKIVRQGYAKVATAKTSCCGPASGCGRNTKASSKSLSKAIGYSDKEMASVPKEANLGLNYKNPIAMASSPTAS